MPLRDFQGMVSLQRNHYQFTYLRVHTTALIVHYLNEKKRIIFNFEHLSVVCSETMRFIILVNYKSVQFKLIWSRINLMANIFTNTTTINAHIPLLFQPMYPKEFC